MPNVRRSMMAAAGAAGGGSTSGAVYFDGTTDLSRGADLTGLSGSDYVTWSYWYKIHAAGTPADFFLINQSEDVTLRAASQWQFESKGSGDDVDSKFSNPGGTSWPDVVWHHVCVSIDTSSAANCHYFVDDSDATNYEGGNYSGANIPISSTNHWIGSDRNGSRSMLNMSIYELWVAWGQYLDVSVTSNRRKFIDASGAPVDLGSDGSEPTGTSPTIYMTGTPAEFVTNNGTGGNYSVQNGALIDVGVPSTAGSA